MQLKPVNDILLQNPVKVNLIRDYPKENITLISSYEELANAHIITFEGDFFKYVTGSTKNRTEVYDQIKPPVDMSKAEVINNVL